MERKYTQKGYQADNLTLTASKYNVLENSVTLFQDVSK